MVEHLKARENHNYKFLFGDKNFGICDFSGGYNGLKSEAYQSKVNIIFEPYVTKVMKQVHGIDGCVVDKINQYDDLVECDFLVTNQSRALLLMLTADCLPVFLYDPVSKSIGAVHAGWKGSVSGIIDCAVDTMISSFHSSIQNIQAILGPCAQQCCYEVRSDFVDSIQKIHANGAFDQFLLCRQEKFYFDLLSYNKERMITKGILEKNILTKFSCCTLCSHNFFSHRKEGKNSGRNMNGIMLL